MRRSPALILVTLLALPIVIVSSVTAVRPVPDEERTYARNGMRITEGGTWCFYFLPLHL